MLCVCIFNFSVFVTGPECLFEQVAIEIKDGTERVMVVYTAGQSPTITNVISKPAELVFQLYFRQGLLELVYFTLPEVLVSSNTLFYTPSSTLIL